MDVMVKELQEQFPTKDSLTDIQDKHQINTERARLCKCWDTCDSLQLTHPCRTSKQYAPCNDTVTQSRSLLVWALFLSHHQALSLQELFSKITSAASQIMNLIPLQEKRNKIS
jgi:hypothetical protein